MKKNQQSWKKFIEVEKKFIKFEKSSSIMEKVHWICKQQVHPFFQNTKCEERKFSNLEKGKRKDERTKEKKDVTFASRVVRRSGCCYVLRSRRAPIRFSLYRAQKAPNRIRPAVSLPHCRSMLARASAATSPFASTSALNSIISSSSPARSGLNTCTHFHLHPTHTPVRLWFSASPLCFHPS